MIRSSRGIREGECISFIRLCFLFLFLFVGGVAVVNIAVNPFSVFPFHFVPPRDVNPRYTKFHKLLIDPQRYDSLIMGNCQTTVLKPETANRYSGRHYFNLATHNALTTEPYVFLRYALDSGVQVNQIILNLWHFRHYWSDELRDGEIKASQMGLTRVWPSFLSREPTLSSLAPFLFSLYATKFSLEQLFRRPPVSVIEEHDGVWFWKRQMGIREKDYDKLRKDIVSLIYKFRWSGNNNNVDAPRGSLKMLDDLRRFVAVAERNKIDVLYIFAPSSAFMIKDYGDWHGELTRFLTAEMVMICKKIYDFSIYSDITLDLGNYITHENFIPDVGDVVLENIFGNPNGRICFLVTQDNLAEYFKFKRNQSKTFEAQVVPLLRKTPKEEWASLDFVRLAPLFWAESMKEELMPMEAFNLTGIVESMDTAGFNPLEGPYPQWNIDARVSWMLFPDSKVYFQADNVEYVTLAITARTESLPQQLTCRLNGVEVGTFVFFNIGAWQKLESAPLLLKKGQNILEMTATSFLPQGERRLAILFKNIELLRSGL